MNAKRFKHAVVVGSGMAGLVTSRVLSDHFEKVTVLERDAAPPDSDPRPGVPQGRHFHGLLPGGLLTLAELSTGATGRGLAAART
jgi:2-polyprenyl-6-methoxyphenol hydroxylase-like FAD-dependent oxidoreductase